MYDFDIEADESLQSAAYGTPEFPFSYYYDEINRYHERSVNWHWHSGLELSFVITGTAECFVGKEKMTLEQGDALFVNQGVIHRFVSHSGAVTVNYVFGPEFISPPGTRIHTQYVLPVLSSSLSFVKLEGGSRDGQMVLKSLIRMHNELEIQADGWELRVKNCVLSAWDDLYAMIKAEISDGRNEKSKNNIRTYVRIRKMLNYIHGHYDEELDLEKIAAATEISKSEALRCFKAGLQTTPVVYLTQYRLCRAKELLQNGEDTVQQIAVKCGFDNSSYFCKVFKKYMGISPLEFCKIYADDAVDL